VPIPSTPSKHTHCEAAGKQEREESPTCESTPSSSSYSPTTSKRMNRTCVIMLGDGGIIKRVSLCICMLEVAEGSEVPLHALQALHAQQR
jgi:tartrate dehydratase beta subunit/fumarate hydratase class I family protein